MARKGGNKKACDKYKMEGRLAENKRSRQERLNKYLSKMAARNKRKLNGEIPESKKFDRTTATREEIDLHNQKVSQIERNIGKKLLNKVLRNDTVVKPFCSQSGNVLWGTNKNTYKPRKTNNN